MSLRDDILRIAAGRIEAEFASAPPTAAQIIRDLHLYVAETLMGPPAGRLEAALLFAQIGALASQLSPTNQPASEAVGAQDASER